MSTIDTYGEMELPEERTEIEVVEDPVKIICSCNEIFMKIIEKELKKTGIPNLKFDRHRYHCANINKSYLCAVEVLNDKEKIKLKPKDIEEILKKLQNKENELYLGLFLSALHNEMNIQTLILDNFFSELKHLCVGYNLKDNKKLILGLKHESDYAGYLSEGTIINYGKIKRLSEQCKGGLYINLGKIGLISFFNFSSHKQTTHINKKTTNCVWEDNQTYINEGPNTELITDDRDGFVGKGAIPLGTVYHLGEILKINEKLKTKLSEISFLETLTELSYEEQYKQIDEFDFNKFEKEVKRILEEICEGERK